jgi:choline dehydrogenase-like flavoprotein
MDGRAVGLQQFRNTADCRLDPATDLDADVLIIGSGMGGATFAAGLADSGLKVRMLECGDFIPDAADSRDPKTVYQEMRYHSKTPWLDKCGKPFTPGNFEWVGGNSKFYGAVLYRFRREDFGERRYEEGISPAWPFPYEELQPWYEKAELLFRVRGKEGVDPTEPPGPYGYRFPPIPDEPPIAELRRRLQRAGIRVSPLPLAVDIDQWMAGGEAPWDQYPDTSGRGKMEAESCALPLAATNPGFKLITNARVNELHLSASGRTVGHVEFSHGGKIYSARARLIVLAAGAVPSAALLLKSGIANSSDQVGRNFMNHVFSFLIAVDPRFRNTSKYQKTLSINDFYFDNNDTGKALGNIQLVGKLFPETLRFQEKRVPLFALKWIAAHSADFFLQTEEVPRPENRVTVKDGMTKLDWYRPSIPTHLTMVSRAKKMLRAAGFPLLFHRLMDETIPYHRCGTIRLGADPRTAPLDPHNVSWDHPNLMVVDASSLVSSAAVNPALTVAALSLRAAVHAQQLIRQV